MRSQLNVDQHVLVVEVVVDASNPGENVRLLADWHATGEPRIDRSTAPAAAR